MNDYIMSDREVSILSKFGDIYTYLLSHTDMMCLAVCFIQVVWH